MEMALWSTLWRADQVSEWQEWGVVSVFHEVVDEFYGMWSGAAGGLKDERDKVDVWISVKFTLLSYIGHVSWAGAGCGNK